jgi:hypothetical protein
LEEVTQILLNCYESLLWIKKQLAIIFFYRAEPACSAACKKYTITQ